MDAVACASSQKQRQPSVQEQLRLERQVLLERAREFQRFPAWFQLDSMRESWQRVLPARAMTFNLHSQLPSPVFEVN